MSVNISSGGRGVCRRGDLLGNAVAGPSLVGRALRMSFWIIYDHLGRFIALNVALLSLLSLPLWIGLSFAGLPPALAAGLGAAYLCVLVAGQVTLVNTLMAGGAFDAWSLISGLRRYGVSALALGGFYAAAVGASALGVWFYSNVLSQSHPLGGFVLAQLCACMGALSAMAALYGMPALVARRGNPLRALKISVLLVARYPLTSVALLAAASVCALAMATPPGLALLSTWPLVTLVSCAYELFARAQDPENAVADEEDAYLNRGFRDFLFPWKG